MKKNRKLAIAIVLSAVILLFLVIFVFARKNSANKDNESDAAIDKSVEQTLIDEEGLDTGANTIPNNTVSGKASSLAKESDGTIQGEGGGTSAKKEKDTQSTVGIDVPEHGNDSSHNGEEEELQASRQGQSEESIQSSQATEENTKSQKKHSPTITSVPKRSNPKKTRDSEDSQKRNEDAPEAEEENLGELDAA